MYLLVPRGMGLRFPLLSLPSETVFPLLIQHVIDPSWELYRAMPTDVAAFVRAIHERDVPVFCVEQSDDRLAAELFDLMDEAGYGAVPMVLWVNPARAEDDWLCQLPEDGYVPEEDAMREVFWPRYHYEVAQIADMAPDIFGGLLELGAGVLDRWWSEPVDADQAKEHDFFRWVSLTLEEISLDERDHEALMTAMDECIEVIDGTGDLLIRL